jgi:uncharacterized protein
MNIVLDTNVIVSGLINSDGIPGQIINLVLNEKLTLLFDTRIYDEYYTVLKRKKFGLSSEVLDPLFDFIKNEGIYIVSDPLLTKFQDESDKKFLEVAVSGNAESLITGNKKHFPEHKVVISPRGFYQKLNKL